MKAGIETMKHYLQATLCVVAIITVLFTSESFAVQKESQAEKEANLKGQALGGLFNRWTFDQQKPEEVPSEFSVITAGEAASSAWTIQADAQAPSVPNILRVQSSCQSSSCYRLLIADKFQYEYPDISVRIRFPSEGEVGQGGLVIGFQDEKNFYAAIVNLASKKLEVIRVLAGQVTVLAQKDITPKAVDWHFLRVQRDTIISKDVIETSFDGSLIQSIQDQSLGLGRVGILAVGNSSLHFDNLYAIPLFSQRPLSSPAAY